MISHDKCGSGDWHPLRWPGVSRRFWWSRSSTENITIKNIANVLLMYISLAYHQKTDILRSRDIFDNFREADIKRKKDCFERVTNSLFKLISHKNFYFASNNVSINVWESYAGIDLYLLFWWRPPSKENLIPLLRIQRWVLI